MTRKLGKRSCKTSEKENKTGSTKMVANFSKAFEHDSDTSVPKHAYPTPNHSIPSPNTRSNMTEVQNSTTNEGKGNAAEKRKKKNVAAFPCCIFKPQISEKTSTILSQTLSIQCINFELNKQHTTSTSTSKDLNRN